MDDSELEAGRIYRATVAGFAFDRDCMVIRHGSGRRDGCTDRVRWWVIRQTRRVATGGKGFRHTQVWITLVYDPKTQCFQDWTATTEPVALSHLRSAVRELVSLDC